MWPVVLEVRESSGGSRRLSGSFPYNETAVVRSSGSGRSAPRKERIGSRAFGWSVDGDGRDRDIQLLVGHSYSQPLASRKAGTLKLTDTDDALRFRADLPPAAVSPSYMEDAIKMMDPNFGLATGVSVGFQIPAGIKGAQRLVEEEGNPGIYIREVNQAVLFEVSVAISRPVYKGGGAKLGKRSMEPPATRRIQPLQERLAWL